MSERRRFGKVRKLPSGRWQASYVGPDGRRHAAGDTFARKSDAGKWLALVESEIMRGVWSVAQNRKVSLRQWAERWLASVEPHLKRTTVATYRTLLKVSILPALGDLMLGDIRPITVGEWMAGLNAKGNSPSWARKAYRLLSQIMKSAVDNEMILISPCRGHRLPVLPEPDPQIITPKEAREIAAGCRPPHDLLVLILAYAGVRIGEGFALRRCDALHGGKVIHVAQRKAEIGGRADYDTPKSHQAREITLPKFVARQLAVHLRAMEDTAPEALLFTSARGTALGYNSWRRTHFDPAVTRAGLVGITPHDLRASHGSWVADAHGVLAAAKRLGHSNASVTTRHYARALEGRDKDIAKSLDEDAKEKDTTTDEARGGHDDEEKGA